MKEFRATVFVLVQVFHIAPGAFSTIEVGNGRLDHTAADLWPVAMIVGIPEGQ